MNKVITPLLFLLLLGCTSKTKKKLNSFRLETVQQQIVPSETKQILFTLAADSMKGRDTKNGGYEKAVKFVVDYFRSHNVKPFYPNYRDTLITDNLVAHNVVGQIGKYDPKKKTILIGAHLDHIGTQGNELDSIYNGANDNASGSTAVLQIGRFLAQYEWNQNILLGLFADEEKGLKGAYHLAKRFEEEAINLDFMINFEMIGKTLSTGVNQVYMTGFARSNMPQEMNAIAPDFVQFLPQAQELNLFKRSDNYAFFQQFNIPSHTISSFDFQNFNFYHKAGDEAEKMDIINMNQIIQTAGYTIAKLMENDTEIKMTKKISEK